MAPSLLMTRTFAAAEPQIGAGLAGREIATPVGPVHVVAGRRGLRAVLWPGEDGARVARAMAGEPAGATTEIAGPPTHTAEAILDRAELQLAQFFAGTRRSFDLDLDPRGTPFQLRAWEYLSTIPFGATSTYAAQAAAVGDPAKARAVGAANGRNPLSIIVPCHRVVASGGALGGFAGGLHCKEWLLEHERLVLAAT